MNLPAFIARRYLFSKKSSNAINLITWVSIVGIGVGTAAIILVLSVFNGLTEFIEGLFSAFDPDIKIVSNEGQRFVFSQEDYDSLAADPSIAAITRTLEGRIGFQFGENTTYGILKGVESNFVEINRLDTFVYDGEYTFAPRNGITRAVFGSAVAGELNAQLDQDFPEVDPVNVFYIPRSASFSSLQTSVNNDYLIPSGFFSVQNEYDAKYVVTDFDFTEELFEAEGELSSFEIRLKDISEADVVKKRLQTQLGESYQVLTWYEQHSTLYRVMKNEKYISYLILVLILAIAAVNIVGSLSMIVIEKTRDIGVLKSIGATERIIRRIFMTDGLFVGLIGGLLGVILAFVCGIIQIKFGVIKLEGGFRVEAFPLALEVWDFILVFFTVLILAILAAIYPSLQASRIKITEGIHQ